MYIIELYLLEIFISCKLFISLIHLFLQIIYFQKVSMSVKWNSLCILPCSVNLRFAILFNNWVRLIFLALLACQHLYASCSWDILALTKSLPGNFRLISSWDLLPRFLRFCIIEFFCLRHFSLTVALSNLFIHWQVCK